MCKGVITFINVKIIKNKMEETNENDETDIELVEATDMNGEDVVLVLVDNAKYILNYYPGTVLSNTLSDFTIKRHIDVSQLKL